MNRDVEIAWAAGLFEGEGCITASIRRADGWVRFVTLTLTMCDADIVERFVTVVRSMNEVHTYPGTTVDRQDRHMWQTNKISEVKRIFEMMRPHLGQRRIERYEYLISEYYKCRPGVQS